MNRTIITLAAVLTACATQAQVITFSFSGVVTYSVAPHVLVGNSVSGQFSYATDTAAAVSGPDAALYAFAAPFGFTATANNRTASTSGLSVAVTDNGGPGTHDEIAVFGQEAIWDTQSHAGTVMGLIFSTTAADAVSGTDLPGNIDVTAFQHAYGFLTEYGRTLIEVRIDSLSASPVPEPSALLLTALGLGPLLLASRRRRHGA